MNPYKFQGNTPDCNWVNLGLHLIRIDHNGTARVYSATSSTFKTAAFAPPCPTDTSIEEAFKNAKEWSKYMWEHNDKTELVEKYGLTKEYVRDYLGYCGYGL